MLPPAGSDLRDAWLSALYDSTNPATLGQSVSNGGCLQDGTDEFGQPILENSGGQLNDNELVPYSVAAWTAQASGVSAENRGRTKISAIGGQNPFTPAFAIQRTLYNVFPTAMFTGTDDASRRIQALFAGPGSRMCTDARTFIDRYGYWQTPNCGDTTQHTG